MYMIYDRRREMPNGCGYPFGRVRNRLCLGFGPPFLGPSLCEVSSAVPEKGCSVALEAAERVCRFSPRPRRPSYQGRQRAGYRLEASSAILNLPPSPVNPSPLHLGKESFPFLLFPFFHWLYLFSSFVHSFPFYQNSPTPFPGRRS